MRRLLLSLLLLACVPACKGEPGPPTSVELRGGSEQEDGTGTLELYLGSAEDGREATFPGGTVTYTVYAGPPAAGEVRCTMTAPVSAEHFDARSQMHRVPITFATDCKPLADGVPTFGVIALELSDGTKPRADDDRSFVPKLLGGPGQFEYVGNVMYDRKQAGAQDAEQAWIGRLAGLAKVSAEGAPPLGTPCQPPPVSKGLLVRADRRILEWIAEGGKGALPIQGELLLATSGYQTRAIVEYLGPKGKTPPKREAFMQAASKTVDYVELVVVEQLEAPTIVDPGAADRVGQFRPGIMKGELWIIDAETPKVLCRTAIAATDVQDAQGNQFDTSADVLAQQFAGAVAQAVTKASAQIAPGLRKP